MKRFLKLRYAFLHKTRRTFEAGLKVASNLRWRDTQRSHNLCSHYWFRWLLIVLHLFSRSDALKGFGQGKLNGRLAKSAERISSYLMPQLPLAFKTSLQPAACGLTRCVRLRYLLAANLFENALRRTPLSSTIMSFADNLVPT